MRLLIYCALFALPVAACTSTQAINRPDGSRDFDIACGAGTGWGVCYDRANELCPSGYKTVSQDGGFNRKELVVSCPPPAITARAANDQCTYESAAATVSLGARRETEQGRLFQQCMAARVQ